MWREASVLLFWIASSLRATAPASDARTINDQLANLSLDPEQIYHVRDVRLDRAGVQIYLTDGILAFAKPVEGKIVAAVFTSRGVDAADAEILALPPSRSERASLAFYTKRPNLNDHFGSAVFFFSDNTVNDCLKQIGDLPAQRASDLASDLRPALEPILHNLYPNFDLNLVEALLDRHPQQQGFFFATFAGRDLGPFSLLCDPTSSEPVTFGKVATQDNHFQLWTSYRNPRTPPLITQPSRFSDYRIHAKISDTLLLSVKADFNYRCDPTDGRSLRFDLSDRLSVKAASIDNQPVEFFARKNLAKTGDAQEGGSFLVVVPKPFSEGIHRISVTYEGEVIRRTQSKAYFVEERNTWYPRAGTTAAVFDLTFECPHSLQLVSSGELIDDSVANGVRTVHRRTQVPQNVIGFNLGEYRVTSAENPPYRVDVFENRSTRSAEDLGRQTLTTLQTYSDWWSPLPFHSLAVTPIAGYFGQGFPGLIYLSDVTYLKEGDRPANLRGSRFDSFFSDLLLPHEIAHQWWGNLVLAATYRTGWLTEAMATHSALEYVALHRGQTTRAEVFASYKKDLKTLRDGRTIESFGPADFGVRLLDAWGPEVWHTITYEKGAWILRMLQVRLGPERWRQLQLNLLREFTARPLTNDSLRQAAADLLPPGQPDRELQLFFDTWVYGTGIPQLNLSKQANHWELEVSGVDDDFSADIPITCSSKTARTKTPLWLRASTGTNVLPSGVKGMTCSLPPPDEFLYQ